jgi:hypothetical protein
MTQAPSRLPLVSRMAMLAASLRSGWRQFWEGYWKSPIGC